MWTMPLMSLWIGFMMPVAMCVYWIANSLFSVIQELIAGKILKKDYEAAPSRRRRAGAPGERRGEAPQGGACLESMSRLMKVAEDCGVLYCCEVVNRFEQYLLNTAKEGVEFVKRLGSPTPGCCWIPST